MDRSTTFITDPHAPMASTAQEEPAQTCAMPLPQDYHRQPDVETVGGQEPPQESESEMQPDVSLLTVSSASSDILPSTTPEAEREKIKAIRPKPQKKCMKMPGGWFWELATWLFGTMSVLAIVLVLALFNHKNVEQWKSSIKIHTIVSVLSQAAVSALMVSVSACVGQMKWVWYQTERNLIDLDRFDVASRGPYGSVIFLCSRRRVLHFAALGAVATILMLGFQPFVQQTVNPNGVRWVQLPIEPTIARATTFQETVLVTSSIFGQSVNKSMPMLSIENAASAGLLRNDSDPSQVSGFCPTANCTWEAYDSLALCSTVEDITSAIILDCHNDTSPPYNSPSDPAVVCNISTTALRAAGSPDMEMPSISPSCSNSTCDPPLPYYAVSNIDGYVTSNGSTIWLDVLVFYAFYDDNSSNSAKTQTGKNLFALKSRLSPCLQKLQTTMINGATQTIVRDSQDRPDLQAGFYGPDGNFSGFESFFNWAGFKMFNVSSTVTPEAIIGVWGDTPDPFAEALFGPNADTFDPTISEQGLRDRMSNFTSLISNAMRLDPEVGDNMTAIGVAWALETFIQVDFLWLIGPIALWLLVTGFLFTTMLITKKRNAPLWKSSVLALLRSQHEEGASSSAEDMESDAEKITVQLTRSGDAWWLTSEEQIDSEEA